MSPPSAPTVADDTRLIELAVEPPRALFSVLNRASAMGSLVVVLAILPCLYAFSFRTMNEIDAQWSLRAVEVLTAETTTIALAGGTEGGSCPPLGSWLAAGVMWLLGPLRVWGPSLVSMIAAACCVGMTFVLFRKFSISRPAPALHAGTNPDLPRAVAKGRLALLTTCLLAFNPQLLRLSQTAAPLALSLLLLLLAYWGFLMHLQGRRGVLSPALLAGGVALGLVALAGGPLVVGGIAVLLTYVLYFRGARVSSRRSDRTDRKTVWDGWLGLQALIGLVLFGAVVVGCWLLALPADSAADRWLGWGPTKNGGPRTGRAADVWFGDIAPLVGCAAVGLQVAWRELRYPIDEQRRRGLRFVLLWTVTAAAFWTGAALVGATAEVAALWQAFLLVPLVALAALAVDEITQRRTTDATVTLVVALTAGCVVGTCTVETVEEPSIVVSLVAASVLAVSVGLTIVWRQSWLHEVHRRRLLSGLTVVLTVLVVIWGLTRIRVRTDDDRKLAVFQSRLQQSVQVDAVALIAPEGPPPAQLRFVVRSTWPEAPVEITEIRRGPLSRETIESRAPERLAVVQWSLRNPKVLSEAGSGWRVQRLSDALPYRGRQLNAFVLTGSARK